MEKADSEITGYAREWEVEPQLWGYAEIKLFKKEGMEFRLYGRKIRAKIVNPSVDWDEFCKRAEDILTTIISPSCALSRHQDFRFKPLRDWILDDGKWRRSRQPVICVSRQKLQDSADGVSGERDTEKEGRSLCLEIMELSNKDPTLRGALNYYNLALKGTDQLAAAGNLYMAMEELKEAKEFTSWSDVYEKLERFSLNFSKAEYEALQEVLQNGRHAYYRLRKGEFKDKVIKSFPLRRCQLSASKKVVGGLILAYVERLKNNS